MLNRKDGSKSNGLKPVPLARGMVRLCLAWCAVAFGLLAGCSTVIPRLNAKFDAEPFGAPPIAPSPTPPNDQLVWRTGSVSSSIVAVSAGRLLGVAPLPSFTSAPDNRQVFLIAISEPFTTSPVANIRGNVRLRLNGLGIVGFGLRPLQKEQTLDFIAAVELGNYLAPASGSVDLIEGFPGSRLSDPFGLSSAGKLSGYVTGKVIDVNWSIDQASRTLFASVSGGPPQSVSFPPTSGGVATTPIQRLEIHFWMQRPTTETMLFIDNLRAEEY